MEIESRMIFPKPETIDLIASALNIRASMLFDERGCPKNAQNTFNYILWKRLGDGVKASPEQRGRGGLSPDLKCPRLVFDWQE